MKDLQKIKNILMESRKTNKRINLVKEMEYYNETIEELKKEFENNNHTEQLFNKLFAISTVESHAKNGFIDVELIAKEGGRVVLLSFLYEGEDRYYLMISNGKGLGGSEYCDNVQEVMEKVNAVKWLQVEEKEVFEGLAKEIDKLVLPEQWAKGIGYMEI